MSGSIKNRSLYSTCLTVLAFTGFAISVTATILPLWGYFLNSSGSHSGSPPFQEQGHFGPWQICKEFVYDKVKCGDGVTKFQPVRAVRMSGYFAILGVILIGVFCLLNVLHLAMHISKDKIVLQYKDIVSSKLVVSIVSEIISIMVGVFFSFQTDDKENSYQVTRGESFYLQIGLIIINFILFISSLYDMVFLRNNPYADPTKIRDPTGITATTFDNPAFRDKKSNGFGIAMTEASGKPYPSMNGLSGSTASMSTVLSSVGSTTSFPRAPLRSSLKKPRISTNPGLGISNPGFSRSSPPLSHEVKKKVRIQTQCTEV